MLITNQMEHYFIIFQCTSCSFVSLSLCASLGVISPFFVCNGAYFAFNRSGTEHFLCRHISIDFVISCASAAFLRVIHTKYRVEK